MPEGAFLRTARVLFAACAVAGCSGSDRSVTSSDGGTATAQTSDPAMQAIVTASSGKVELSRGTSGSWSAAKVGDRLSARDALRTDLGEADLSIDGVKVRLHDASRLVLKSVDKRAMRTRIRGSVESEVDKFGRLDVEVEDSDATAHSEGGHFFVTADGRGVIAVAAVTGTVHLSSKGKSVDLNKGQVSRVEASADTPSPPAAALRRVLLSVQWPNTKETKLASVPIAGRVEPGSRVYVQGQPVTVEAGGLFRAEVPLKQGKQKVSIVTVDALGRRKQVEAVVKRDDSLPGVKVKKKLWQWH